MIHSVSVLLYMKIHKSKKLRYDIYGYQLGSSSIFTISTHYIQMIVILIEGKLRLIGVPEWYHCHLALIGSRFDFQLDQFPG